MYCKSKYHFFGVRKEGQNSFLEIQGNGKCIENRG